MSISWRSTTPRMSSFCNNRGESKLMRNVALFNVLHGIWIITTSYIWWIYPTSTQMLWEIFQFIPNSMPVILCCTSCEIECLKLINISQTKFASPSTSLLSPDAMEGNIKYIISQYTRGDTPCTTCNRLRFVSNLIHSFLAPWWWQPWYRQAPYMVVRRNAFALCCSAYHNRPILRRTTCHF